MIICSPGSFPFVSDFPDRSVEKKNKEAKANKY